MGAAGLSLLHIYLEAGKLRRVFHSCNLRLHNTNGLRNVGQAFSGSRIS